FLRKDASPCTVIPELEWRRPLSSFQIALQLCYEMLQVDGIGIDLFPPPIGELKGALALGDNLGRIIAGEVQNEAYQQTVLPVLGGIPNKVHDPIEELPYDIGRNRIPDIACKVKIILLGERPGILPGALLKGVTIATDFIN